MTQATTTTTTTIRTTVILEFTSAPIIRCRANRDMPEYNLTEGQVFYCVKSVSSTTNEYHIVVWSYERMQWNCPCTCGEKRNHTLACGHTKAVAKNCSQAHSAALQGYKPKYDAVREANEFIARIQREKAAKAAADWQSQGFSPRDEAYYNAKFARDAEMQAAYNRQLARQSEAKAIVEAEKVVAELVAGYSKDYEELAKREKAARGSLASGSRHMEMAPSGRMVFMR